MVSVNATAGEAVSQVPQPLANVPYTEVADTPQQLKQLNTTMLYKLMLIVPLMLIFCASMVPLYRQICAALGLTATRAIVQNSQIDTTRLVPVQFVSTLNQNFAWRFEAVDKKVEVHPGAQTTVMYRVSNPTNKVMVGRAVPSFSPQEAGAHFSKIECFCFSNQTMQPGETRDMPVTFFVSPDLPKDISMIALSYTFFDVTADAANKG
jgi:cytochrome c oxidase assembly protein subunit 11